MLTFLFGSNNKKETHSSSFIEVNPPKRDVFLVVHKNTQEAIGVFDNFQKAKEFGKRATYCTCMIYKFTLNDQCRYLNSPIYEDK